MGAMEEAGSKSPQGGDLSKRRLLSFVLVSIVLVSKAARHCGVHKHIPTHKHTLDADTAPLSPSSIPVGHALLLSPWIDKDAWRLRDVKQLVQSRTASRWT